MLVELVLEKKTAHLITSCSAQKVEPPQDSFRKHMQVNFNTFKERYQACNFADCIHFQHLQF